MRHRWTLPILTLLLDACSSKPPAIVVSRVLIDAPASFDGAAAERESLRRFVRQHILAQKEDRLTFGDRPSASHNLRLRLARAIPPAPATDQENPDAKNRQWAVVITLESLGRARGFQAIGRGGALPASSPDDPGARRAIDQGGTTGLRLIGERGFTEGWRVVQRMRQLEVTGAKDLLKELDPAKVQTCGYAIERLGRLKTTAAIDPLLDIATDRGGRQDLILKSIGALVAIGDERVVDPLIDLTTRQEPAFVLQIMFAVSSLGGRTAEGFLLTMSEGHPNAQVQRGAKDALNEMLSRRTPAKDPGPP